jgi:Acetyltransferase (GNAT) family
MMKNIKREDILKYETLNVRDNVDIIRNLQKIAPYLNADYLQVNGGAATYDGCDAWNCHVTGWGSVDTISDDEIDRVFEFYRERPCNFRVQLSTLADPTLICRLEDRGLRVRGYVVTAGRDITEKDLKFVRRSPFDIRVANSDEEMVWCETLNRGFMSDEDVELDANVMAMSQAAFRTESTIPFLAFENGKAVAGAVLAVEEGVAHLVAAATLPSFRGRGAQTDIQKARIAYGAERGATELLFEGMPGSTSFFNAQKQGLDTLFTSTILSIDPIDNLVF